MSNDIEVKVGASTSELETGMSRTTRVIAESIADIKQQFDGFGAMFSRIQGMVGGIALGALGKQVIDVMSSFEQLEIRLNSVMGSAEKGQEAFAWIKQFAQDTPFEVDQVTQSFMLLKNMGLDPMDGTLKAIADQAAKTGGGVETLQRVSLALGQAWTKGKLQGEEAMQLLEAGVPVWDMLAKVVGKTTEEVQGLSSKGHLGRDVIKALVDEIGRTADGAAVAQMQSLAGQMSNLADNAKGAVDELRRAGGLDPFKQAVAGLNAEFDQLEKSGTINRWASGISNAMRDIADTTREALGAVSDMASRIAGDIGDATDAVAQDVDCVKVATQTMATLITEASYFVQTVWASFAGVVRDIRAVIVTAWEGITLAVGTAREYITGHIEVLIGWFRTLGNVAGAVLQGDFSGAAAAWDSGLQQIQNVVATRTDNIVKLAKDAQKSVADAWKTSGVMTASTKLDQIQTQRDQRIQRIFAPQASYSNEGRPLTTGAAKPETPQTKRPKLAGGDGGQKAKKPPSKMSEWSTDIGTQKNQYQLDNGLQEMPIQQEIAFWEARKGVAAKGSGDIEAIEKKLSNLRVQEMRENLQKGIALTQVEIDRIKRAGEDKIDLLRQHARQQLELGNITQLEYLEQEKTFEREHYEIARAALQARLELAQLDPTKNVAEIARINADIQELEREHQMRLADIRGRSAFEQNKPSQDLWGGVESDTTHLYQNGLQRMLEGTLSFKQALEGIWTEIGRIMIKNLILQPAAEWAAERTRELAQEGSHHAAKFAIQQGWLSKDLALKLGLIKADVVATAAGETTKTGATVAGEAARTGATASGVLARLGLKSMEAIKSIMMSAWEAMASAFKAIVGIPYVGPALAVGAGAAAFGLVSGIAGKVKSARGGYSIPRGVNPMTQLHEEEMVLPKAESNVIRSLADGKGGNDGGSAGSVGRGGDQYTIQISAIDARGVKQLFMDHGSSLVSALKAQGRNFAGG